MAEETMPAADAATVADDERIHYELAFHLLPTVAEEEVEKAFESLKALIGKEGGETSDEEEPKHYELAYTIEKVLDGRRQNFETSYFGWVRFRMEASKLEELKGDLDARQDMLRYIIIKLTKEEEQNPHRVHDLKPVVREYNEEDGSDEKTVAQNLSSQEEDAEVKEEELEESLEKITS